MVLLVVDDTVVWEFVKSIRVILSIVSVGGERIRELMDADE